MAAPLVSILINNYNYAQFLREAIESTFSQSYRHIEIIVVDDGSTDQSREIIASFGSRLTPVFKENAGQASAFNFGVAACQGDILCFLDSDDFFYPGKVARIVEVFNSLESTKPLMVHHRLKIRQEGGKATQEEVFGRIHDNPLNLAEYARKYKFMYYPASATTGISINRRMSDLLFPLPDNIPVSADDFIVYGASLVGELHSVSDVLGGYRVHGNNHWYNGARRKSAEFHEVLDRYLNEKLQENNLPGRIWYSESMWSWWEMARDERWAELAWRALRANAVQHDLHTLLFSYGTCVLPAGRHFFQKVLPSRLQRFKSKKKRSRSSL
jgi:glycosyltransferase involved in cell wall biosynthesis